MKSLVNRIQNRKLRKLIRDPKQFFLDSKELQPIFRFFGLATKSEAGASKRAGDIRPIGSMISSGSEVVEMVEQSGTARGDEVTLSRIVVAGLEVLDLCGENWELEPALPIAVFVGFNPWKRNFTARYFPEYRVAFTRGKTPWPKVREALDLIESPRLVVWSYSESPEVTEYAQERGIPISRMEDGFIRSANLGSEHSTPLSLVIDHSGLYFDANRPSDLELLLNTHNFSADEEKMRAAETLIRLHKDLGISKYNQGAFRSVVGVLGMKIKPRVLVIGQVEQDASIKYGLAEGWTCLRLIQLAFDENPGAEIIYKPHPDVLQGFRSNSTELKELQKICRVVMSPVTLAELFSAVDRVYTITSLSGFEALVHGLPVTVVGAPFYAGWGLTDDRQSISRRSRKLTLTELFCGAYLLYPRYLGNIDDPVRGCLSAILSVTAQRRLRLNNQISIKNDKSIAVVEANAQWLAASDYWLVLFAPKFFPVLEKKYGKKLLSILPIRRILAACGGDYYQRSVAYILIGKLRKTPVFGGLLNELRTNINSSNFEKILTDLWSIQPSAAILAHWAWHCERVGNIAAGRDAHQYLSFKSTFKRDDESLLPIPPAKFGFVLKLAQYELRQRNLDEATRLFNNLLLSDCLQGEIISGLAEIARLRFDFSSSAALLKILNHYDPTWGSGRGLLMQAFSAALGKEVPDVIESIAVASFVNPQLIGSLAEDTVADLSKTLDDLPYADSLLSAVEVVSESGVIARAKGLISHDRAMDAERLLLNYVPAANEMEHYCLTLSQAYSFQGKMKEAADLIRARLNHAPTLLMYREGLRVAVLVNDRAWTAKLLAEVEARDIAVGEIYHRKAAAGLRNIKDIHLNFRKMLSSKTLKAYLGDRYVQSLTRMPQEKGAKCLVVAYFGPGDEIRWASLYRRMKALCGDADVTFTCDPRLYPLLKNSFPELTFEPVRRIRNLNWMDHYEDFDKLPGSDLCRHFDNRGWELAERADRVILQLDAVGDLIHDYESFEGRSYLRPEPAALAYWKRRVDAVAGGKPVIGLSWRSGLMTYSRNGHYLSVDDLLPVLEKMGHVQFVNLQYDDCSEELAYLNDRFPGRVLNFEGLDHFNDLSNVAALMSCMDMIIAPATTVVEMAGSLGVRTLFLANSVEDHWRQRPGTKTDVWHSSITHIEGKILGNKASLAESLLDELLAAFPLLPFGQKAEKIISSNTQSASSLVA